MRNRAVVWVGISIPFILVVSVLCGAQAGKVESIGALTDGAVPEAVRQALDAKGYRLTLDYPTPACELWIRKSIPAQAKIGDKTDICGLRLNKAQPFVREEEERFVFAAVDAGYANRTAQRSELGLAL